MKMFTYNELSTQNKSHLLQLINWYNLGTISKYSSKSDIIDFILEKTYKDETEEEPQMSVRIRRIVEANK
jgi:hypothetical protein